MFVNNRRSAERVALRLNELAEQEIARAHHGSLAREERTKVEELLKAGELPCLVATSSLELGIDMGAVDLVLQIESPKSVARGLQRIGRAGHGVDEVSRGRIFPKFRGDLLECAVVARRMREGLIEPTVVPRNALDVLAQQIVAIAVAAEPASAGPATDGRRRGTARSARAASRSMTCTRSSRAPTPTPSSRASCSRTCSTCSTGATRRRSSASCARASSGTASRARSARARASRQLAIANAGTIPDRGLFAVTLPDGRRVGELDEEMVYEARPGQAFLLGASTWRIEEIGRDRVIVTPAPGAPGRGAVLEGRLGRPPEGARRGDRRVLALGRRAGRRRRSQRDYDLDERAGAQPARLPARAAGRHARAAERAHDRGRALPRRDRRLAPVRALALRRSRPRRLGPRAVGAHPRALRPGGDAIWTDDGIVLHLPDLDAEEAESLPSAAELVLLEPEEVEQAVVAELGGSALFGARFRENAVARAADPARLPRTAHAAVAAAPEGPEPARGGAPLRRLPDRARDLPRVPARRARRARACEDAAARRCTRARSRSSRSRPPRPRRSPPRCCSTTSPPTCTRATRPPPSAARPRCRSTATCCASCSARRSCAS